MFLFGLPIEGGDASSVSIRHALGQAFLDIDGKQSLVIQHYFVPKEQFKLDRFSVYPCYTEFNSASQISELRIGDKKNTFGYIFPVTSFRNEIGFEKKFGLIYGDAAFRKFLTVDRICQFQSDYTIGRADSENVALDTVVNDALSILIVSNEVLGEHKISRDMLDLMLRKNFVEISELSKNGPGLRSGGKFQSIMHFNKPKIENADDLAKLNLLLRMADEDNSKVGQFIQYYQFFEYMILKVFEWGIPHVARGGASPWDVKERLSRLGGERHRLERLTAYCTRELRDRSNQGWCAQACREFLEAAGVDHIRKKNWQVLLYLVRNNIVHNQFKFLSSEYSTTLDEVNRSLRAVALDCIFHFEPPGIDKYLD